MKTKLAVSSRAMFIAALSCVVAACGRTENAEKDVCNAASVGEMGYLRIGEVWPQPDSSLTYSEYALKGVGIEIWYRDWDLATGQREWQGERTELCIDGNVVDSITRRDADGLVQTVESTSDGLERPGWSGPWWISWNPELVDGKHTATFVVAKDGERALELARWEFEVR